MSTTLATDPDGTLRLRGSLCIYDVEHACDAILAHLAGHPELVLDVGEIGECDAAGLQLLVAASRSAGWLNKPFRIRAASAAVETGAASLGFASASLPLPTA